MTDDRSPTRSPRRHPGRPAGLGLLLTLGLAGTLLACSSAGAGPTANPTNGELATPRATPTQVPGQGAGSQDPGGNGGTDPGGGSGSNPGTGILPPGITLPVVPVIDESLLGDANYLTPVKGLINQHDVNVQLVRAAIGDDGHTYVDLRWYSGVAPCNQLDSVKVIRDDATKTVSITVVEGSAPGDQMCIELAELHATAVDLGVLEPGTWTISAQGDAPAITLEVE